jgi:hypothetical protein
MLEFVTVVPGNNTVILSTYTAFPRRPAHYGVAADHPLFGKMTFSIILQHLLNTYYEAPPDPRLVYINKFLLRLH